MKKHPLIPKHLNDEESLEWLKTNAVETFNDTNRHYFGPEEITEFEHESSVNGREFNRLKDIVKVVTEAVAKGNLDEPLTVVIPVTLGTKVLEKQRRQNDDNVEKGFEEYDVQVYAIPSIETESMEFFTDEGKHIEDRSRPMSMKEKHQYIGIFQMQQPKAVKTESGDVVDENTGEVLKTGTDE